MQPVSIMELGQTAVIFPTQVVWEMLGQVSQDRTLNDFRWLTGEEPICVGTNCYAITYRLTGSEGFFRKPP